MVELRNISRRLAKYHNCKIERIKGYLYFRTEDDDFIYFYIKSKKYMTRRRVKTYEEFLNAYRNGYVSYFDHISNSVYTSLIVRKMQSTMVKFDSLEELIMKLDLLGV